jgi:xanthine dehydrogenase YagS FAD-binding subunit
VQAFELLSAERTADALRLMAQHEGATVIAGGTTVIDLMKCGVTVPRVLIDITRLPLAAIEVDEKRIRIGALVSNSAVAFDKDVAHRLPMLSKAFSSGASGQLRNMATVGGNLLQRTRCPYFRDPASQCNKRNPGAGCDAFEGVHRGHAILGTSEQCIATHPSDAAVALIALDAIVEVSSPGGMRRIPVEEFYLVPNHTPALENVMLPGELITALEIPAGPAQRNATYLKVRDRSSYEFALVSVAAGLEFDGDTIVRARLALGGVGTIPWRVRAAEEALAGKKAGADAFRAAAAAAVEGAIPRRDNAFKVELAKRAVVRALETVVRER